MDRKYHISFGYLNYVSKHGEWSRPLLGFVSRPRCSQLQSWLYITTHRLRNSSLPYAILPSVVCPALQNFSTLSRKRHNFKRKISYFMEWSPSCEANWFSAREVILCFLWNLTVHYRFYNCRPAVPILNQINPVHKPTLHFLKIHFNIILPSMPGSYKWFLFFMFSYQNPVYTPTLPHTCYM